MKQILFTILTAMAVLAGNYFFSNGTLEAKVETPTPMVTSALPEPPATSPAFSGQEISFMGISFIIPPGLAIGTRNETVPQSADVVMWPAHTRIVFQNYPLQNKTYEPQVLIFPAGEYAQIDDVAKQRIDRLKIILGAQNFSPQPIPDNFQTNRQQEEFPFLPNEHAGQVFHAQENFISFKNGTGIRYITQLSQAAFPLINNTDIFYTFQGLTTDGRYYVSVIMPVNLPYLAADYGPEAYKNPTKEQNPDTYPGYVSYTIARLNQAEGAGTNPYAPSLASLDALVQSISAGTPAVNDPAPSTPTGEPVKYVKKEGIWITNLGRFTLKQTGPEITATMDGYGNPGRQDILQGTWKGDSVSLNSQMLGDLELEFSENTFQTIPGSRGSFCGIRASLSNELPAGCGFSGTWLLAPDKFFPQGSTMILKQVAKDVTGDFYDGKGNAFDKFTGQVEWGKGARVNGKIQTGHSVTLVMNSFETGFEYIYDDLFQLNLCAVKNGLTNADLGNFMCDL